MTGMLASVTSVAEAGIVLNERVNLVDVKDPHTGALGALEAEKVAEIVARVQGAIPVSATVGDIQPNDPQLPEQINKMAMAGVDIVKVGLFDAQPTKQFIGAIAQAANQKIDLVIVLFAENYTGSNVLAPLFQTSIYGIMLDTKDKHGKGLRGMLPDATLAHFIDSVKQHELLTGLAGSLRHGDVESLLALQPDYLGFRGALCSKNSRANSIDQFKVKQIRNAIPQKHRIRPYHRKNEVWKNGTMA